MSSETVFLTGRVETSRMPEPSDYEAVVAGVHYRPRKGQEPSAFHRWMQGWAFGVRWRRVT